MASPTAKTKTTTKTTDGKPRRRLPPDERKRLLLAAARKVFSQTGDPTGTTMKSIAKAAGISEGIIYRHFESKEQLYFEAIVEPLTDAIASYVEQVQLEGPIADLDKRDELRALFWRNLITSLQPMVPLMGLVLFGEPSRAREFYRSSLDRAVEVLAQRWSKMFGGRSNGHPSREVALSVIGIALMFSVDARFKKDFDLDKAIAAIDRITKPGFWPELPRR